MKILREHGCLLREAEWNLDHDSRYIDVLGKLVAPAALFCLISTEYW